MATVSPVKLFLTFLITALSTASIADEKPLTSVADLRYGVALYHYHQDQYMEALTTLLIASEQGGIKGHGDNPEIMEGGFALAYGMERHASDIFVRLLEENRPRKVRDAAWFYLAKVRYSRGDWMASKEALDRVSDEPDKSIRSDIAALKINLAIQQDNLSLAETLLQEQELRDGWLPYANFNLGSAWARQNNWDAAVRYYNRLAEEKYNREEHKALYDQAMTAAGYSLLWAGKYAEAITQFSRVRLDSKLSNSALLGYGWAAANLENYKEALRPWQHLSNSSLIDENSQEALVAVPYAYEKLGADSLALDNFKKAEIKFEVEIERLDEVIANLQGDAIIDVLNIEKSEGMDWLTYAKKNQLSPQLSYLVSLFSKGEFQGLVQEVRDLLAIKSNLDGWEEKLIFYSDMMFEREQGRNTKAELLEANTLSTQIREMEAQRADLARAIEKIASEKDYFALTTGDEADLVMRAKRSMRNVELLHDDPFIDEMDESVRRYYGILLWDASEEFSGRLWRAVKTLNALDRTLKKVNKNHDNVKQIISDAPDLGPYKVRLAQAQRDVANQQENIDRALNKTKNLLRDEIVNVLLMQKERLNHYLAQSRLAIARLYDKARTEATHESN